MTAHEAITAQYQTVLSRRENGGEEQSYTVYLYQQGLTKILKKCGEETFESVIAAKNDDTQELLGELNDVIYHITVLLCFSHVPQELMMRELNERCRTANRTIDEIYAVIVDRKNRNETDSYTAYLFREGLDKILKKVGEACSLLLLAGKDQDPPKIAYEAADVLYHLLAVMVCKDIPISELADEIVRRSQKTGNLKKQHETDLNS